MRKIIDATFEGRNEELGLPPGVGIAANQIGWDKRVLYIHLMDNGKECICLLANPKIKSFSKGKSCLKNGEGCLSVKKNHEGIVPRYSKILVEGYDLLNNQEIKIQADGFFAICLQHELDHLDGILYYDHINQDDPMFVDPEWVVL